MNLNRAFNLLAGFMIMLSVLLTHFVNYNFIFMTGFIGLMSFQSGITGFCPGRIILGKFFKDK